MCLVLAAVLAVGCLPAPAFAAAGEGLAAASFSLFPQAVIAPDYSWYTDNPGAETFTISSRKQFMGFANLVNGKDLPNGVSSPVDFSGKKVQLAAVVNLIGNDWEPIGSEDHPFAGDFEGGNRTVDNFKVTGTGRAGYLGLFGYVSGSVSDVIVGQSASISIERAASSADVVHHVGAVAGYCAGSMSNCANKAPVTVTSAVGQTAAAHQVVYSVGGVAGECAGGMTGCTNEGAVSVTASAAAAGSVNDAGLVRYVGGVAGMSGNSSLVGTQPAKAGAMSGCTNLAQVTVETPSTAGTDRHGKTAYALSVCVGGIVGYAQGDVTGCKNGKLGSYFASETGYVRAEHGTQVGGIAGSLRATPSAGDSMGAGAAGDDGTSSTAIELSGCVNYGDVYALATVGGIVGAAGSYTTVTGCTNALKKADTVITAQPTYVVATRWNKPAPAGIAGMTSGTVSYCANFATVASGTWKVEKSRTLNNGSGYFASGLVGMTSYFTTASSSGSVVRTTPLPEVYGCLSAGSVVAQSGMRQCGLVSVNVGRMHDNVLRKGMVEGNALYYGKDSTGTEARNQVLDDATLRTKAAVAALNGACDADGWANCWVPSIASSENDPELNFGYPVLEDANPVGDAGRADLAGAAVAFGAAAYTGGTGTEAAVPAATVTLGGAELVRNADYRVVPQEGAKAIKSGYTGKVSGIGQYAGEASGAYSIVKGRLSDCTVTVEPATFDYDGHYPRKGGEDGPGKVTVTTSGGVEVDPSQYDIAWVALFADGDEAATFDGSEGSQPVNASEFYVVTVKVASGSTTFETTGEGAVKTGSYRISPANLQTDASYDGATVTWAGATGSWISSGDEADTGSPATTYAYTGSPVKPAVSGVTCNGHELVEGKDYRVVYGNPTSDTTAAGSSLDANNIGNANGSAVGCVTVRSVTDGNFANYQNMFFTIRNGLAGAQVTGLSDQYYTGRAITPAPTVRVGSKTLAAGSDYTVSYRNNTALGTATVTITGKGSTYGGMKTATFKIVKRPNTLSAAAKAKQFTVKAKKVKKKTQAIAAKRVFAVSGAQGAVSYKKKSGNAKVTVSSAGKVSVKKGCKKGTYTIAVRVTAAGNGYYLPSTATVSFKVKVK